MTDGVTDGVTDGEKMILMLLAEDPAYSYQMLADKLGISRKTISERVKSLKDKGILKRIGTNKSGYWEITKE